MSKVLYIESSPRKQRSKSIQIAHRFLEAYQSLHPSDQIETLDLWNTNLPEFDGFTIDAKYQVLHGQGFTPEQSAAWQAVVNICEHFKSADKYVISLPMWNFGIPYKLKHYIDILAQPGQTFSFTPETGYTGLVTGKPLLAIFASGGAYSTDGAQSMDFQRSYLTFLLSFIGFQDIHSIVVEPTLAAPDDVAKTEQIANEKAVEIAKLF